MVQWCLLYLSSAKCNPEEKNIGLYKCNMSMMLGTRINSSCFKRRSSIELSKRKMHLPRGVLKLSSIKQFTSFNTCIVQQAKTGSRDMMPWLVTEQVLIQISEFQKILFQKLDQYSNQQISLDYILAEVNGQQALPLD